MTPLKFRTRFNRIDSSTALSGETRTNQQFKDDCDINKIVGRCLRSVNPIPLPSGSRQPFYADFGGVTPDSYLQAQNMMLAVDDGFAALPATVRDYFGNDPARLLAFLDDPNNRPEAIRLGLITEAGLHDGLSEPFDASGSSGASSGESAPANQTAGAH